MLLLAARTRRRRPKRRYQLATAAVVPDESEDLFLGVRGCLGCVVVGWFRGRADRRSVFLPGSADPMVRLLASSSRFDFF